MMFVMHIAFSTALVTLTLGFALLGWSKKETNAAPILKLGGTTIVILAILNMLCIGYYGIRYWEDGYFKAPNIVSHDPAMGMMGDMKGMMGNMKGMMEDKMKKMQGESAKPEANPGAPEEHENHEN